MSTCRELASHNEGRDFSAVDADIARIRTELQEAENNMQHHKAQLDQIYQDLGTRIGAAFKEPAVGKGYIERNSKVHVLPLQGWLQ